MQTKWNPIVDGDLSGIPTDEYFLFTIIDEDTDEPYVIFDEISLTYAEDEIVIFYGYGTLSSSEKVIAWMEVPEPFKPGRCDMCKHNEHWTDCFGDRWSKCKFSERMFVKGSPIEKEVD